MRDALVKAPGGPAEIHLNKLMRERMGETLSPRTQADKTIYYLAFAFR
jgi:hypothetical protein